MLDIILLVLFLFSSVSGKLLPTEKYSHHATLKSDTLNLYWKFNDTHITFEVHGQTTGWIGIGFSPNGAMTGADIIVGWVKDGTVRVTDRHGVGNSYPPLDPNQDILVLDGSECEGSTMFKFSRQLAACEADYDREISQHTQRLIWAFGERDPTGNDLRRSDYHGDRRGGRSMYFLEPMEAQHDLPQGPEYKTFDIRMKDFHVPGDHTYYNCKIFKVPNFKKKHHIVKIEPIIQEGNIQHIHHILVFKCHDDLKDVKELEKDGRCYSSNMPHFATCVTVIAGWTIGASPIIYPEVTGMSIGTEGDPVYIQMQIHYDNPLYRTDIVDNSGIRFTYTDILRQHDVGVLAIGTFTNGVENFIPPGAESFTVMGHCKPFCMRKMVEKAGYENITALGVILHSHLAGRKLRLRHIRDRVELPFIADDQHYDFNYQEIRNFHPPITIQKNDYLRMECVYSTADRKNITQLGYATREEMCLSFVFYYPKIELAQCLSSVPHRVLWNYFGISSNSYTMNLTAEIVEAFPLKNVDVTDQISPNSPTPITLEDHFNSMDWTPEKTKQLEKLRNSFVNYGICMPENEKDSFVQAINVADAKSRYIEPQRQCLKSESVSSQSTLTTRCFDTTTSNPRTVSTRSSHHGQSTRIQQYKNSTATTDGQQIIPIGTSAIVGMVLITLAVAIKLRS